MSRVHFPLLMLLCAAAQAGEWRMSEESEFLFEASWEGTPLPGRFDSFGVRLDDAAEGVAGAVLTVTVELAGSDMEDPDINEAIAGPEWFAVAEYPAAVFTSQAIREVSAGEYLAEGELALKGRRKPVAVPFRWTETGERAEMKGELVIDRTLFDVGSGEWASGESIGIDVRLTFTIVLVRQ